MKFIVVVVVVVVIFALVSKILCMLGLKILELFCTFLGALFKFVCSRNYG